MRVNNYNLTLIVIGMIFSNPFFYVFADSIEKVEVIDMEKVFCSPVIYQTVVIEPFYPILEKVKTEKNKVYKALNKLSKLEDLNIEEYSELDKVISAYEMLYIALYYWGTVNINNTTRDKVFEKLLLNTYSQSAYVLKKYYGYILKDPLIANDKGSFILPFPSSKQLTLSEQKKILNSFQGFMNPFLLNQDSLLVDEYRRRRKDKLIKTQLFIDKKVVTVIDDKTNKEEVTITKRPFDKMVYSHKEESIHMSDFQLKNKLIPRIKEISSLIKQKGNRGDFSKTVLALQLNIIVNSHDKELKDIVLTESAILYWFLTKEKNVKKSDFIYSELKKVITRDVFHRIILGDKKHLQFLFEVVIQNRLKERIIIIDDKYINKFFHFLKQFTNDDTPIK